MRWISAFLLKLFGWKVVSGMPEGLTKAVVVMAPHTSYWDFVVGRLAFFMHGISIRLMIKKEMFFFPLGPVLKAMGGIPVDRANSQNAVKSITRHFNQADSFYLVIAPEGTRKLVKRWKRGFYFIALQAKVPVILGFLDYKKREGGLGPVIYPSGDYEKDLRQIEAFYRGLHARYPGKFNLS